MLWIWVQNLTHCRKKQWNSEILVISSFLDNVVVTQLICFNKLFITITCGMRTLTDREGTGWHTRLSRTLLLCFLSFSKSASRGNCCSCRTEALMLRNYTAKIAQLSRQCWALHHSVLLWCSKNFPYDTVQGCLKLLITKMHTFFFETITLIMYYNKDLVW